MKRNSMKVRKLLVGAALTVGLGASGNLPAFDMGAEVTIDYRQGVMRAIGGNVSSTAAIVIDGADFGDNLMMHVRFLVDATQDIPSLFPVGSDFGETDALPSIWEQPEKFAERSRENHEAALALLEAVEQGDEAVIRGAFRDLGQSCRSCHEDFRQGD